MGGVFWRNETRSFYFSSTTTNEEHFLLANTNHFLFSGDIIGMVFWRTKRGASATVALY